MIVAPALAEAPVLLDEVDWRTDDPMGLFTRSGAFTPFTAVANVTGQPAIALPLAEHEGLPVGVQLFGRPAREGDLLAVAAQLEATGVRMFGRHLGVLEQLAPDDRTTQIIRDVISDERRHAKSCAAAARKLVRPEEADAFISLQDKIAEIDRAFGVTISLGFWLSIAVARLRGELPAATQLGKAAA